MIAVMGVVFFVFSIQVSAQCDGVPSSGKEYDSCGVCGGNNACVCDARDPTFRLDRCGYCGSPGDKFWNVCVGCDGVAGSGRFYDVCGVCEGNNSCVDCGVVLGAIPLRDACGECGGKNTTCAGCDGVPHSNKVVDRCGVCGGTNNTCDKCKQTAVCGTTCDLTEAGNVPLFCECARKHVLCGTNDNSLRCEPLSTLCNGKDMLRGTYILNCPGICEEAPTVPTTAASDTTSGVLRCGTMASLLVAIAIIVNPLW
jgi:hypothetical protein